MTKNTDEKLNIQEAIKAFGSDDITNAGINLFSVLGYDTSLQAPLDKKTYSEFQENYIDASPAADRFSEEKARVSDWKSIDILFQLTNDSFNGAKSLFEESVNPTDMQSYLCFAIELKENEYSKTQIANVTREINKLFSIPIIIIYKYGKNLTLAIINRRVNKCNNDRDVLEKVTLIKDIFYEKPHRAHIEILFDMSLAQLSTEYTIYNFETLHKAWSEVLDTQALNKRFYTELSNWYFWAIKTVVYPGYEMESEKNGLFTKEDKLREHNAKNLIRLLTRLLFVWFIKEKDLIPEELFDEQSINDLITSFEPNKYYFFDTINKESKSVYYKAILQNLFFASLNAEQGKRAFRLDGQNQNATSLMRYKRYHKNPESFVKLIESKVPFMNGGLFECLDSQDDEKKGKKGGAIINYEDGFSDRKDNKLFVPDYIFFGKDVKVDLSSEYDDKKKKDVTVNGIINILQKYKFTIAENTPVEEDIALDPELLGRVFENLLASYNPETKTNARKQTGSFYTPRPIVEYMVDESLKAYLKTKIKDAAQHDDVSHSDTERPSERSEESLDSKLDNLISYNENEPEFTEEERFQILKYIDECKILDPACGSGAFPMGILQKMVYVIHKLDPQNDNWKQIQIQKISNDSKLTPKEKNELQKEILTVFDDNELDYARKLYLIENCIHGIDIQPIATQISRLRFFISLIVDQKVDEKKPNFGVRPLPNLENRFVTANSLIGLDNQTGYLAENEIGDLKEELKTIRHKLFNAKSPAYKFELKQKDKEIRGEIERVLLESGFGKENASMISTWDPYDKNKSAEFFDAEWMFGIKAPSHSERSKESYNKRDVSPEAQHDGGFDIVIGNPPYVTLALGKGQKIFTKKDVDMYKKLFPKSVDYKGNTYAIFYDKSLQLINKNGIVSFITPNSLLSANSYENLRKLILKTTYILSLVNFKKSVFESAETGGDLILVLKKESTSNTNIKTFEVEDFLRSDRNVYSCQIADKSQVAFANNLNCNFMLQENKKSELLSKIVKGQHIPLGKIVKFYQGIITGNNKEFLSEEKKNEKWLPIIRGRDFTKYSSLNSTYFVYFDKDKLWSNTNEENFNAKEKLINRQTGDSLIATYDDSQFLTLDSTHVQLLINPYFNLKFILGLFNSKLLNFVYTSFVQEAGRTFAQVKTVTLKELPIPNTTPEQQQEIIDLVDKILAAKRCFANAQHDGHSDQSHDSHSEQSHDSHSEQSEESTDTTALEHKIDELVYKLYGLTEEEIAVVEGK